MGTTTIPYCDETMNFWIGCTHYHEGCVHCFAESMNKQRRWVSEWGGKTDRRTTNALKNGLPQGKNRPILFFTKCGFRGTKREHDNLRHEDCTDYEERRRVIFANDLSDTFEDLPLLDDPRRRMFQILQDNRNVRWLLLTKRIHEAGRVFMRSFGGMSFTEWMQANPHVGLGVSVSTQKQIDEQYISTMLSYKPAFTWVSFAPLLGRIILPSDMHKVNFAVIEGESGEGYRPLDEMAAIDLIRSLKYRMVTTWFKQVGGTKKIDGSWGGHKLHGRFIQEWPEELDSL